MTDLKAKRTLVKSPPELWSELSEVESLARHLGEFGEIRITKLEPETTVAWEGERASGTVEIEASGWGTKVTLTAAVAEEERPAATEPQEPEAKEPEASDEAEEQEEPDERPAAAEPVAAAEPEVGTPPEPPPAPPRPEPAPAWQPRAQPRAARPHPEPSRGGFFSRLFGRRAPAPSPPPSPAWQPPEPPAPWTGPDQVREPSPVASQPVVTPTPVEEAVAEPEPPAPAPEPRAKDEEEVPPAAEPAAPALDPERALAVLEGTLDTLGSAHHRPFSRG